MRAARTVVSILAAVVMACGGAAREVKPDEMGAEQHRAEARKENRKADDQLAQYDEAAAREPRTYPATPTDSEFYLYPTRVYDPSSWRLRKAQAHRDHARQHEAAAEKLEAFVDAECKEFPPASRAACPILGPIVAVTDVQGGVRIEFAAGVNVDALVAHMRCHFAYAQAEGFPRDLACPLYVKGIRIERAPDARAIQITAPDKKTQERVRKTVREMAIPAAEPPKLEGRGAGDVI